jgi:hypothetical protein
MRIRNPEVNYYNVRYWSEWLPLLEGGEKLLGEFLRVRLHLRVFFIDEIPAKIT